MKCEKCNSEKLTTYSDKCLYKQENNSWIKTFYNTFDTAENSFYLSSKECFYKCLDCKSVLKKEKTELPNQVLPQTKGFNEIVLDLDATLISSEPTNDYGADFKISIGDYSYFVYKRPNLKEFIDFLCKNFDKINFFTAGTKAYSSLIVPQLGVPENKLGWVKTREDCFEERSNYTGEIEQIKKIENALIVDDRPEVYSGVNTIIRVEPFFPWNKNDTELLKVMSLLGKDKIKIKEPTILSVHIFHSSLDFYFEKKDISFKDSLDLIKKEEVSSFYIKNDYIQIFLKHDSDVSFLEEKGFIKKKKLKRNDF